MSLLDELANYSSVSSFFSEFTLSTHQLHSSASQPDSFSNYYQTNAKNMSDSLSTIHALERCYERYSDGDKAKADTHKQYYEEYRKKLTKINSMVTLLSAKTRKIKYQFMVHLQRWAKTAQKKLPNTQTEDRISGSLPQQHSRDNKNIALLHSILSQMAIISEKKLKESLRFSFNSLNTNLRTILKGQFIVRIVEHFVNNKARILIKEAWQLIKSTQNVKSKAEKVTINKSKPIFLTTKQKAPVIKVALDYVPLTHLPLGSQINNRKLSSLYPQNITAQSLDYHDNITLFIEQLSSRSQCMSTTNKKTMDLSFSNNACVSVFEADKESSSQKSFIKQLSDVEMTAVPQAVFTKRKISDFTSLLAEHRANQNYSHVQIKKPIDSGLNLIKSQVNLHNNDQSQSPLVLIFQKDKQKVYNSPKEYCLDTFSNEYVQENEEKYSIRRYSYQKERILRSGSEARMTYRQSMQSARAEIDRDYHQEMKKYTVFKQYLQKRRQTTLKSIEKNQEILKKLMMKLEKSKQKVDKLKLQIKPKEYYSKDKQSGVKKLQLISKVSTPSKSARNSQSSHSKTKRNSTNKNERTKDRICRFSLEKEEQGTKRQKNQKNMDIYFKYMKQKTIMENEKATQTKKNQNKVEENLYSSKRKSAKADPAKIQKNILAISKFPCAKQQRIDLKIELGKPETKKTGRGAQKERLKLTGGSIPFQPRQKCTLK